MSDTERILERIQALSDDVRATRDEMRVTRDEMRVMRNELLGRIDAIDTKIASLSDRVSGNEGDIAELKSEVLRSKHEVPSAFRRLLSLQMNGIDFKEGENLKTIFENISTKLGYQSPPHVRLIRFKSSRKQGIEADRRPIQILFSSLPDKENFMQNYKVVAKNLQVGCINGFQGLTTRIYIQDVLDPQTYLLRREALRHKKAGRLVEVSTIDLHILVRVNKNSRLIRVDDIDELKMLTTRKAN